MSQRSSSVDPRTPRADGELPAGVGRPSTPVHEHEPSRLPDWLVETPYWAISGVVHLVLLLLLSSLIMLEVEPEPEHKSLVVREAYRPTYDPTLKRDVGQRPKVFERNADDNPMTIKLVPIVERPKGREENIATCLTQTSLSDPLGIGGGTAGTYGDPTGTLGRIHGTGPIGSSDAVIAALHWLQRHQHPDGYWSANDFGAQCVDQQCRCHATKGPEDRAFSGHDVGVTGLAMLAFLGAGHTDRASEFPEFVQVMKRARKWMLQQQQITDDPRTHGIIGHSDAEGWIYNHAIATFAMAELLYLSSDRFTGVPRFVEEATRYILRARNPSYAWRYQYQGGANDTSVTGWMVLALKTAKGCSSLGLIRIDVDDYQPAFEGSLAWLDRATSKLSAITGYRSPGDQGSQLHRVYADPYPYSKELSCMTAVGVLCRLFSGQRTRHEAVRGGVKVLSQQRPLWRPAHRKKRSTINMYYWYYGTYALFQYGGPQWKRWNEAMLEALLPTQRLDGCEDGSWDPVGEWGAAGGRVYSTAIGAMTLEVYYRYRRQSQLSRAPSGARTWIATTDASHR